MRKGAPISRMRASFYGGSHHFLIKTVTTELHRLLFRAKFA
jgi:hypothetical protein